MKIKANVVKFDTENKADFYEGNGMKGTDQKYVNSRPISFAEVSLTLVPTNNHTEWRMAA